MPPCGVELPIMSLHDRSHFDCEEPSSGRLLIVQFSFELLCCHQVVHNSITSQQEMTLKVKSITISTKHF